MAPRTRTPSKDVLRRWQDAGYTQEEMVALTRREFGEEVSRSAIAAAMVRHGLAETGYRYDRELPWRVNPIHATAYPVRMLRLLGRSRRGGSLNQKEYDMLEAWLDRLDELNLIVAYDHDDHRGFYYINDRHIDHSLDIPIRRQQLDMRGKKRRRVSTSKKRRKRYTIT